MLRKFDGRTLNGMAGWWTDEYPSGHGQTYKNILATFYIHAVLPTNNTVLESITDIRDQENFRAALHPVAAASPITMT